MKTSVKIIISIVLLLNIVVIIRFLVTEHRQNKYINDTALNDKLTSPDKIDIVNEIQQHQYENDGIIINSAIEFISSDGNTFKLKELFNKPLMLVLFIKESTCLLCIENEISIIKELLTDSVLHNNVLIVKDFPTIRGWKIFEQAKQVNVYKVRGNTMYLPIEVINVPFYFTLSDFYMVYGTYIPHSGNESLSIAYLQSFLRKLDNYTNRY